MGSYQPGNGDVTGSLRPAPPPPTWTWEGGTPIVVAPGETLEMHRAAPWRAGRRHHGGQQHHQPGDGASRPASGDSAPPQGRRPPLRRRRPASRRTRKQCPRPCRSVRRELRSRRPPASTSWRRARRSTASRGSTASRCWCSPKPTTSRRTRMVKVGERIVIPGVRAPAIAAAPAPRSRRLRPAPKLRRHRGPAQDPECCDRGIAA